jgi:hypothetical protein
MSVSLIEAGREHEPLDFFSECIDHDGGRGREQPTRECEIIAHKPSDIHD